MSALWVDKYRPQSLDRLDYHKEQAAQLARLAAAGDLPHMLFYGPSGAGKKTRVMALLRAIFGAGVERVKLQHRAFKTPSGKAIEVTTIASSYHIERVASSAQQRARSAAPSRCIVALRAMPALQLTATCRPLPRAPLSRAAPLPPSPSHSSEQDQPG